MAESVRVAKSATKKAAKKAAGRPGSRADKANLDEGILWPTAFALTKLTAAEEARIAALVKKAVS